MAAVGFFASSDTWSFPSDSLDGRERLVRPRCAVTSFAVRRKIADLVAERLLEMRLDRARHVARRLEDHVAARPEGRHLLGPSPSNSAFSCALVTRRLRPRFTARRKAAYLMRAGSQTPATGRSRRVHGRFTGAAGALPTL